MSKMLAVAVLMIVTALGAAVPAWAHGGEAVIDVESSDATDGLSVAFVVRVTWADDGHAADDASVTVVAESDGAALGPFEMNQIDDQGRYEAVVTFPAAGDWLVRFTAIEPTGTIEVTTAVVEQAPDTTVPRDTSPDTSADDVAPETTILVPATGPTTVAATTTAAESDETDDDSGANPGIAVAVAALIVAVAVTFVLARRRG